MEFWQQILVCLIGGFVGGGGGAYAMVKALVRTEARKELNEDIEKLHGRINKNESDYVTCKFCTMQHDNLNTNIADIKGTVNKIYDWITVKK